MKTEKPRIFYGYVVVAAAFVIMTVAWGANRTFGVFLDPMVREFGWTRAGFSGAFTLGMINLGLISLLAGRLADKIGPRTLLIACSLFLGIGYALSSQIETLWHLYLFYGVFTGIGMSGAWAPIMSVVTRWFVKNRSLMSGLIAAGPAIGIAVLPPLFSLFIQLFGWRVSFLLLGALSFLIIFLGALFLKRDPAEIGASPYGAGENSASGKDYPGRGNLSRRGHSHPDLLAPDPHLLLRFYADQRDRRSHRPPRHSTEYLPDPGRDRSIPGGGGKHPGPDLYGRARRPHRESPGILCLSDHVRSRFPSSPVFPDSRHALFLFHPVRLGIVGHGSDYVSLPRRSVRAKIPRFNFCRHGFFGNFGGRTGADPGRLYL